MAVVIPINLSYVGSSVSRVLALFPLDPPFQTPLDPSGNPIPTPFQLIRDETAISFGFPFSPDNPLPTQDFTDPVNYTPPSGEYPIPPNAYALVAPSIVYGTAGLVLDSLFSVLLIDATVAPVEPGFLRLRIDYLDNNFNPQTDYRDMPFWEQWDSPLRDVQAIVDYSELGFVFLQNQYVTQLRDTFSALQRGMNKALTVSGTLCATQANTSSGAFTQASHDVPLQILEQSHSLPFNPISEKEMAAKSIGNNYNILSVSPNPAFAGDTIEVTINGSAASNDQIYLANIPLKTTLTDSIFSNILRATIPQTFISNFKINLRIGAFGLFKSQIYPIQILGIPNIQYIQGSALGFGSPSTTVTLFGENFGSIQGNTTITFSPGVSSSINSWSSTQITCTVPVNAQTGNVTLTSNEGKQDTIGINIANSSFTDTFAISPAFTDVLPNGTTQFTALLNSIPVSANWSIETPSANIGTGNVAFGFINTITGLYTAPPAVNTPFTVNICANHLNLYGNNYTTSSLIILPNTSNATVSPSSVTLNPGQTTQFTLLNGSNPITQPVQWFVNGIVGGTQNTGLITASGLYQAPTLINKNTGIVITGVYQSFLGFATVKLKQVKINNSRKVPVSTTTSTVAPPHSLPDNLEEKIGGPPSCIGIPLDASYFSNVNETLTITTYTSQDGTNDNGNYTVTATLQPQCGNQDGTLVVLGNNTGQYGTIQYSPGSVGTGFASIYVTTEQITNQGIITTAGYLLVTISAAPPPPPPILLNTTSGCPGQGIVVSGQNFPSDALIKFVSNNVILQTVTPPATLDGTNYTMGVTIPSFIPLNEASYPIYLYSISAGNSNQITLNIPSGCTLPPLTAFINLTSSVPGQFFQPNESSQFTATLEISDGTSQDVTQAATWYVNDVLGGNSTFGTIPASGSYTAPATPPTPNVVTIQAVGIYNNNPVYGDYSVIINNPPAPPPTPQPPPTIHDTDCVILTVSPATALISVPAGNQTLQFNAELSVNHGSNTLIQASNWFVNGIAGGNDIYGTINSSGTYNPPTCYVPPDIQNVTIGANYSVQPVDGPSYIANGYAIGTYVQSTLQTGSVVISVDSQINVFFGDGRSGYIPVGANVISLDPSNYLVATYNETLDQYFCPINVGESQLLPLTFIPGQGTNMAMTMYNEGVIYQDSSTGGVYTRPLTIVLGFADAVDGLFHSIWDLIKVLAPLNNPINPQPIICTVHGFTPPSDDVFSLTDFIETKTPYIIPPDTKSISNKLHSIWSGNAHYTQGQLVISDQIKYIEVGINEFNISYRSELNKIPMKQNDVLLAIENNSKWTIQTMELGDILPEHSHICILGVVFDKFYSMWPFFNVTSVKTDFNAKTNSISLGDMILTWGSLDKIGSIKFKNAFKISYTLHTSAMVVNKTLNGFDYSIINSDAAPIWFAAGS